MSRCCDFKIILTIASACNNGGATYACPTGSYLDGTACNGQDLSDTQTCKGNLQDSFNFTQFFQFATGERIMCVGKAVTSPDSLAMEKEYQTHKRAMVRVYCSISQDLVCKNGGSSYACSAGSYKTGTSCTGLTLLDTQTCDRMRISPNFLLLSSSLQ